MQCKQNRIVAAVLTLIWNVKCVGRAEVLVRSSATSAPAAVAHMQKWSGQCVCVQFALCPPARTSYAGDSRWLLVQFSQRVHMLITQTPTPSYMHTAHTRMTNAFGICMPSPTTFTTRTPVHTHTSKAININIFVVRRTHSASHSHMGPRNASVMNRTCASRCRAGGVAQAKTAACVRVCVCM